jgi:ATP-dependent protease HslVU (ClpYQ) peptidase subunit
MTCIVAIAHGGRVVMGGDSALTADDFSQLSMAETKVFRHGDFLVGGSGSSRGGQLMRFKFKAPARPKRMDADQYMATLWVDELRRVFKDGGHLYFEEQGGEESSSTNALVAYRGAVWVMYGADFQIERVRDPYIAIGAGAPIALGALHATQAEGATRKRVEAALRAACAYNAACRPPFTILTLAAEP